MNRFGKTVDKTFLSVTQAEKRGFIHRDYLAHCLRWTHVAKKLYQGQSNKTARILDIGCGKELPLPMLLYSSKIFPEFYCGVDYGPINPYKLPPQVEIHQNTDFLHLNFEGDKPFTHAVCFEMLEHIEPKHAIAVLKKLRLLMDVNGIAFFSTPNWNIKDCAANHVNEMRYEVVGSLLESCGWQIDTRYGTFASISDYKHKLQGDHLALYEAMHEYYDVNMLSCLFAPLFPAESRNCLWVCSVANPANHLHQFAKMSDIEGQLSSSSHWIDFRGVDR